MTGILCTVQPFEFVGGPNFKKL